MKNLTVDGRFWKLGQNLSSFWELIMVESTLKLVVSHVHFWSSTAHTYSDQFIYISGSMGSSCNQELYNPQPFHLFITVEKYVRFMFLQQSHFPLSGIEISCDIQVVGQCNSKLLVDSLFPFNS